MADRIYIIPIETITGPRGSRRVPKYVTTLASAPKWGAMDYGSEDIALVGVRDITSADHSTLAANADVIAVPENLDNNMTAGQVAAAITFYDSVNLPSDWINTNRTVREVVKITGGLFQFNQRWRGMSATRQSSPFKEGLNLDTQYQDLSDINKARVLMVFESMAVDYSALTATSTIGHALRTFAIEILDRPLVVGGIRF